MYWSIDDQNNAWDHRKIKGSNYITYIYSLILVRLLDNEYTIDYITS